MMKSRTQPQEFNDGNWEIPFDVTIEFNNSKLKFEVQSNVSLNVSLCEFYKKYGKPHSEKCQNDCLIVNASQKGVKGQKFKANRCKLAHWRIINDKI